MCHQFQIFKSRVRIVHWVPQDRAKSHECAPPRSWVDIAQREGDGMYKSPYIGWYKDEVNEVSLIGESRVPV